MPREAFHGARHFDDVASADRRARAGAGVRAVLVKGSRFMKMEQVVAALLAESAEAPHAA